MLSQTCTDIVLEKTAAWNDYPDTFSFTGADGQRITKSIRHSLNQDAALERAVRRIPLDPIKKSRPRDAADFAKKFLAYAAKHR